MSLLTLLLSERLMSVAEHDKIYISNIQTASRHLEFAPMFIVEIDIFAGSVV